MYEEIYMIIKRKSLFGKVLDYWDLKYIFNLYVKENDLHYYARKFKIIKSENNFGSFNFYDSRVSLNIDSIKKTYNSDNIYLLNLRIVQVLLHELTHAKQHRFAYTNDLDSANNGEDFLDYLIIFMTNFFRYEYLNNCYDNIDEYFDSLGIVKDENFNDSINELYQYLYTYNPCERLAEIDSFVEIENIVDEFEKNDERRADLLKMIREEIEFNKLRGYELYNGIVYGPTDYYMINTNMYSIIPDFWNYTDTLIEKKALTTEDLFDYGLLVPKEEYVSKYNNYELLNGKNNVTRCLNYLDKVAKGKIIK